MGPAAGTLEKDGNLVSGPFSGQDIVVVVNEGNGRHERFSQWTAQARDPRLHVEADKAGPNCDIDLANWGHFSGGLRDGNARQSESFLVGVSTISHSRKWNRNGQGIGH